MISQVRAAKPQIELPDLGDVPAAINALEVQIYFTVDRIGYLWPGLATTMDLRADGAPGGPGPWVVNRARGQSHLHTEGHNRGETS